MFSGSVSSLSLFLQDRAEYQQLIAAEAEQAVAVEDLSEACAAAEDQGVPCLVALCVVHLLQAGDVSVYHSQAL